MNSSIIYMIIQFGVVLVSTGFVKLGKPLVDWDHVKTQKLKINANDNLAYAA